jgi:hypothetical protein
MSNRAVVWALAILAIVLVVIPLLGMLARAACCGGMGMGGMMSAGNVMGMHAVGLIWLLLAAAVVVALIVVLVRGVSRV